MVDEIWRPIVGSAYEVSNAGRVRRGARVLAAARGGEYQVVGLSIDGKKKTHSVHRLVAAAFLGACPPGQQVNHKDGDKHNNREGNLEYVTRRENVAHAKRHGLWPSRAGERGPGAVLTAAQVVEIRAQLGAGTHPNVLAAHFGVSSPAIYNIRAGRNWKVAA